MPNDSFDYTVLPEWLCRLPFLFCVLHNGIREDERVSAFRNFFMSPSAESFSFFVFDTVQSEGTNKWKSRM
jgi:hypothetical protein